MSESVPVVIVGGGPAGIAAGISLGSNGLLLERLPHAGGQSMSIQLGDAYFDIGGHSFHTPHPFVRDLVFDSLEMYEQKRNAQCYVDGELIPYPFQKNFRQLTNTTLVEECAAGLELANPNSDVANFNEFIDAKFGPGIAKHFMTPYNNKLWARDLAGLATNWVGERIAAPEGVKESFSREGGARKPLQGDTKVGYPAKGGFGEIFTALSKKLQNVRYNTTVAKIDEQQKLVVLEDGHEIKYEHLISTMPLPNLLEQFDSLPKKVTDAAGRLHAMSLKCVMIALDHPVDTEIQRVYCADADVPAHKIAMNHNSSDWLRGQKHSAIMGECSYSTFKPLNEETLVNDFVSGLHKIGVVKDPSAVFDTKVVDVKHAYPVPSHDREGSVNTIKEFLAEFNISTLGRFGEWAYINSDEALARGLVLGKQLSSGAK